MHYQTRPSLVQLMACCLFSTEPLFQTMLDYCQLSPWEHIGVKFESKYNNFYFKKSIRKCCLKNICHIVLASIKQNCSISIAHIGDTAALHWVITTWSQLSWTLLIYIDGLLHDCSISSVLAMEMLQSCIKPSIYNAPVPKYEQLCTCIFNWTPKYDNHTTFRESQ